MGTNGYIVIIANHKCYLVYNHLDSYPSEMWDPLTESIRQLLQEYTLEELKHQMETIHWVKYKTHHPNVYQLFHTNEGDCDEIVEVEKYDPLTLGVEFIYEMNLDNETLTCLHTPYQTHTCIVGDTVSFATIVTSHLE